MIYRREFLLRALRLSAAGLIVPESLRSGALLHPSASWASARSPQRDGAPFDGRVVVWVNLSGGNDGLNTVVPYQDPAYYQVRPTLALPRNEVVPISRSTALHPALRPLQPLYEAGKLAAVQGVGYPDMDLSHFRGTDIWMSGSAADSYLSTGWLARFIEASFPSFPETLPPSPFGLQQSFSHRLPLTGARGLAGVIVDDPSWFRDLIGLTYPGAFDDALPDTYGGDELSYLRRLDRQTAEYAEAIQAAAEAGATAASYPDTDLGYQLAIVARLLAGGLHTPVFIVAEYGFDTHAEQAAEHATRLDSVGRALAAFWTDLGAQGLAERVLIMTTSEFGRRVEENASRGTDHGTAAPQLILGAHVRGGIYGPDPDLRDLDEWGNLRVQHDYRDVYATVLRHHFGSTPETIDGVFLGTRTPLGFLDPPPPPVDPPEIPPFSALLPPAPNPISAARTRVVSLRFQLAAPGRVVLQLHDAAGRRVARIAARDYPAGTHELPWAPGRLTSGLYMIRIEAGTLQGEQKLVVLP